MPESLAAVGTYFAGTAGVTVEAAAGLDAAAGMAGTAAAGGIGGTGATAGVIGTGGVIGAGGAGLGTLGNAAVGAATSAGVQSALAPKPPKIPGAVAQPDAQEQAEARKRAIAESMARRGRASTILTEPSAGTLGG